MMNLSKLARELKPFIQRWVDGAAAALRLDDLADVAAPSPAAGNVLQFDGTNWIDADIDPTTAVGDMIFRFGTSGQNYARYATGARAYASSTYLSLIPDNTIDDDPATYWNSNSPVHGQWIYVDLQYPIEIERIQVIQLADWSYGAWGFTIACTDDPNGTWTDVYSDPGLVYYATINATWTPVRARYWRITALNGNHSAGWAVIQIKLYAPLYASMLAALPIGVEGDILTVDSGLPAWVSTATPAAHKASHENGGSDEISVAGLSGELADAQPAKAHKTTHENGGADEISVAGLSGELADAQTPKAHNQAASTIDVTDAADYFSGTQVEAILAEIGLGWAKLARANTFTLPQTIAGSTDAVQLAVKGYASQTANLVEWQNSTGTALASINAAGGVKAASLHVAPTTYRNFQVLEIPYSDKVQTAWYYLGAIPMSSVQAGVMVDLTAYCAERPFPTTVYQGASIRLVGNGWASTGPKINFSHEVSGGISDTNTALGRFVVMLDGTTYKLYFAMPRYGRATIVGSCNGALSITVAGNGAGIYIPTGTPIYNTARRSTTRESMGATTVKSLTVYDESTLGAEMLTNGDFAATTGWTASGCTFAVASNQGTLTEIAGVTAYNIYQAITCVIGRRYYASVKFNGSLASGMLNTGVFSPDLRIGTAAAGLQNMQVFTDTVNGDVTVFGDFVATATTHYFTIYVPTLNDANTAVTVWSAASCKEIIGGIISANGSIDGLRAGITTDGGFYTTLIAGEALSRGHVVAVSSTTNGQVVKNPIDGDMPVGVVFQDVASGAPVKIVTSGTAYVLPDTGITAARGNVIYSSSTAAGLAQQAASVPADATHFKEIGHFVETGTANGALAKAIIHFN